MVSQIVDAISVPFCFACAWGLMGGLVWVWLRIWRQDYGYLRHLHSIPCSSCHYFSGNCHLNCALHPAEACTEGAIACSDWACRSKFVLLSAYSIVLCPETSGISHACK